MMCDKFIGYGIITYISHDFGIFIAPITAVASPEEMLYPIKKQVFVHPELIGDKNLEVGKIVRYEFSDDETIATNIETIGK